jgi:hypothetical protein
MYIHISNCKNNKIKFLKNIKKLNFDIIIGTMSNNKYHHKICIANTAFFFNIPFLLFHNSLKTLNQLSVLQRKLSTKSDYFTSVLIFNIPFFKHTHLQYQFTYPLNFTASNLSLPLPFLFSRPFVLF